MNILSPELGTPREHEANFHSLMRNLEEKRRNDPILQERGERNIEGARNLLRNLPLTHTLVYETDLINYLEGAKKDLLSNRARAAMGSKEFTMTGSIDRVLGLDNYVFALWGKKWQTVSGVLLIDPSALEIPGTIATLEDIAEVAARIWGLKSTQYLLTGKDLAPDFLGPIIKAYREAIIPGARALEYFSNYIATYYPTPEHYLRASEGKPDPFADWKEYYQRRAHIGEDDITQGNRWADESWRSIEIKIPGRVPADKIIGFIGMSSPYLMTPEKYHLLLERAGIKAKLIEQRDLTDEDPTAFNNAAKELVEGQSLD